MKLSQMEKLSHHHFCCRHTMVQIGGQKPIGDGLLKTPRDEEVNTTNFWYRWMCACACEWMSLMYRDTSTNTHYIHVHSRTCTRFERVAPNEPITWFIWRVCVCVWIGRTRLLTTVVQNRRLLVVAELTKMRSCKRTTNTKRMSRHWLYMYNTGGFILILMMAKLLSICSFSIFLWRWTQDDENNVMSHFNRIEFVDSSCCYTIWRDKQWMM